MHLQSEAYAELRQAGRSSPIQNTAEIAEKVSAQIGVGSISEFCLPAVALRESWREKNDI